MREWLRLARPPVPWNGLMLRPSRTQLTGCLVLLALILGLLLVRALRLLG